MRRICNGQNVRSHALTGDSRLFVPSRMGKFMREKTEKK